jgi:hypothetical protein
VRTCNPFALTNPDSARLPIKHPPNIISRLTLPLHRQLYTLPSRIAFADWTPDVITTYRGPTPEIVAGLAESARKKLESTYTIGESGTAGPTGGETRNRTP